uniref:BZIP domain-containing protein n=1 Tax=Peronospora matthiolae TaxID=2874970 RepID=A0AAV1UME0_9STRA
MDQRNAPYGMLTGREGLPGGMPPQQPQQQQRVSQQQQQQQHYSMQDMIFDPLPMGNGMYHQPAPVGGHLMHPHQQPGTRAGGMQVFGSSMAQQSMVTPEDDLDDLMSALGDSVGMNAQQQNVGGHMPSHVYDHMQPRSLVLHPGSSQGLPMSTQMQSMQQGMGSQSMHMNQMPSNDIGAAARMGVGMHQQPNVSAPSLGGIAGLGANIQAPIASRQQAPTAIVPALATPKFSDSSRTLTTSSNNGGSSDEDAGMGEGDVQKKKERRRQQVRYASRRRRKKQKDEESFLRDRIAELKEQIRIIGGDLTEQCSQMAGMSEQALTEAYEKQMVTVQTLRKDNNKLKEQLLQHENFARMIQYGLNALPSDCRDVDRKKIAGVPMWISDQMNPLKGPTLVVDLNLCHEAVRHAYNELKTFGPTVNSKTNVCYAMGWKTELWAASTCLNFRAVRSISDKNIREVANASWDIITCPEKFKRIYPDVKQFRILQKVTDDIVVVHRIASVASDLSDREFISVAFRFRDGDNYFIGIKSITVQTEAAENCIRGEECQGWMFVGDENETPQWKAHFLGYYDVKGEKDDKVLNQLANESMFGMLRWESEAMHPLSA